MVTVAQVMNRGDIWMVDLEPVRGHEQGGKRPALVLSADIFNHGPAGNVILIPITSRNKRNRLHVLVQPPEGGLKVPSYIKCEDIRAVSKEHCDKRMGAVSLATMVEVEEITRTLLEL
ncbi:MAG TPA: type II toxin-antitoxin system PemK/MazF family toxin [Phycisphaerae bacterium]|nr:type II toxin-antitoxin system PemK/MazF family toxin [Phycisphaerae bacterium]